MKPVRLELSVLVGASSQELWGRLHRVLRMPTGRVTGVVTGTKERAHVVALDARPEVEDPLDLALAAGHLEPGDHVLEASPGRGDGLLQLGRHPR